MSEKVLILFEILWRHLSVTHLSVLPSVTPLSAICKYNNRCIDIFRVRYGFEVFILRRTAYY